MNENYIETIRLRTRDCDMHGGWRLSAVLEAMQETAVAHSDLLDAGRAETDARGMAWVLSRCRVDLARLPVLGETVSVETYTRPARHLFYPRVNVFRDGAGNEIGQAASLWVLMDLETRRITDSPELRARLPENRDRGPGPRVGVPARPPEGAPVAGGFTPGYADFDINGHVNNTRYLDWCCSALGFEVLAEAVPTDFEISYESELLPGAALRTELTRQGDRFAFLGFSGERRCFCVTGALRPRRG